MTDQLSRAKRKALMARVKTRDTAPEVALRQALWAAGVRGWRLHPRQVTGRPDFAWIGRQVAVFVDGAFWHGHPDHYWGQSGAFWDEKIERNRNRDKRVTEELVDAGWTVLRFWDFEVEREVRACVASVRAVLETDGSRATRREKRRGAKSRILAYLVARTGQVVRGEELAEISGIQEWPRRVRELRVEDGYAITEVGSGAYRLESDQPDLDRASAWKTANVIRRRKGSAIERIGAFLEARVGKVVSRDQIDYVARIAEGSRRVRELRDEHGWPIDSRIDEPTLGPGEHRLTSTDPSDRRDPLQRLYPEDVRQRVFERDDYTCQACNRNRAKAEASGDDRFYLEVHHKAVAEDLEALPQAELTKLENLVTLCHADHRKETAKLQRRKRKTRRPKSRR